MAGNIVSLAAKWSWSLILVSLGASCAAWGDEMPGYEPLEKGAKAPVVKLAGEIEEQFVRRGIRFNDSELQEILDRVAERVVPVVADAYIDYRVYLIRDPSPRAVSFADGQIYVHTGLLARLENEAQLAAVIAHEAHHVAAHHHIEADRERRTLASASGFFTFNDSDSGFGGDVEFERVWQTEFTPEMESAADIGAAALIGRAGYPPVAVMDALAILRKDPELTIERETAAFNSSESLLARQGRLGEVMDELPQLHAGSELTGTRPLQLRRVIEMTVDDYIRLDRPGAALSFVELLIAEQPDAFLHAAKGDSHLALGPRPVELQQEFSTWVIVGRRAEKTREEIYAKYLELEGGPERLAFNLDSAKQEYETAIELDENYARAYRGLGNFYYEQKDYRPAGRNYLKYLKLEADPMDRQFVLERLQHIKSELTKQKEANK